MRAVVTFARCGGCAKSMANILIVDDQAANREFLRDLLGYRGHFTSEAEDGAAALALVTRDPPDLIISDILMPTMDGYELVRALREDPRFAAIPVIFASAYYLEREARALAERCGVALLLHKPMSPEVVLEAVDTVLGSVGGAADMPSAPVFESEHRRLLVDKLSRTNEDLRMANARLAEVLKFGRELGLQRDPTQLMVRFARAGRAIIGARSVIVAIHDGCPKGAKRPFSRWFTCGPPVASDAALVQAMDEWLEAGHCTDGRISAQAEWDADTGDQIGRAHV